MKTINRPKCINAACPNDAVKSGHCQHCYDRNLEAYGPLYFAEVSTKLPMVERVAIERMADFWWVVEDGKPSYPCTTYDEARQIASVLIGGPE